MHKYALKGKYAEICTNKTKTKFVNCSEMHAYFQRFDFGFSVDNIFECSGLVGNYI